MKKTYEKPTTSVVMLKYKSYLLTGSPVESQFVDDKDYDDDDWDFDGGQ